MGNVDYNLYFPIKFNVISIFQKPYAKYIFEKLAGNSFLDLSNPFLYSLVTIAVLQIRIILNSIHFSNDLFCALIKLSFDKYIDILGSIFESILLIYKRVQKTFKLRKNANINVQMNVIS